MSLEHVIQENTAVLKEAVALLQRLVSPGLLAQVKTEAQPWPFEEPTTEAPKTFKVPAKPPVETPAPEAAAALPAEPAPVEPEPAAEDPTAERVKPKTYTYDEVKAAMLRRVNQKGNQSVRDALSQFRNKEDSKLTASRLQEVDPKDYAEFVALLEQTDE